MCQLDAAKNWFLRNWDIILDVNDAFAEFGEDFSLTERNFCIFCHVIEGNDHVFDLVKAGEEFGCQHREPVKVGDTSSPQRNSSPCLSLTLSQV